MPQRRAYGGPKLPKGLLEQVDGPTKQNPRRARAVHHGRTNGAKATRGKYDVPLSSKTYNSRNAHLNDESDGSDDFEGFDEESSGHDGHNAFNESATNSPQRSKKMAPKSDTTKPTPLDRRKQTKEDIEIKELEKKLGIAGKKRTARDLAEDGLDSLLEGIDDSDSDDTGSRGHKRKNNEDEAWLESKRSKSRKLGPSPNAIDEEDMPSEELVDEFPERASPSDYSKDIQTRKSQADSDQSEKSKSQPKASRENPYVAPGLENKKPGGKYIPPSLRGTAKGDEDMMWKLKRSAQGLINRLSETNLLSILGDFEQLYRSNPRQYVSSTIIGILLDMTSNRAVLLDSFLTLHAGFIAGLYKLIGADFGAQVVERICLKFDEEYKKPMLETSGKEAHNLISLLAQLYVFQVINSTIIFDYLRVMLSNLSELNTELLLRVVRSCGQQLRQDDPSALKDIVVLLQRTVAETGVANLSVRSKFMIDTIHDLKNNRSKSGLSQSLAGSDRLTSMKKTLAHLNSRHPGVATEPLAISLADLRNAEKSGKWWLVGASWKGHSRSAEDAGLGQNDIGFANEQSTANIPAGANTEVLQLAKQHHMNTDIRRAIFITIMAASDYKECHMKLLKLDLSRNQEREIPRVLLHCATAEPGYNPYYTLVASRLCSDRKVKLGFQHTLQNYLKRITAADDEEHSGDDVGAESTIKLPALVNTAKLYGELISGNHFSLAILKGADFIDLTPRAKMFIEVLFITIFQKCSKPKSPKLETIFNGAGLSPDFARTLQLFLKNQILNSDLTKDYRDEQALKKACRQVIALLKQLGEEQHQQQRQQQSTIPDQAYD